MKQLVGILAILAVGAPIMFGIYKLTVDNIPSAGKEPLIKQEPDLDENQEGQFGIDRVKGKDAKPVAFDGKRAMKYLEAICALGPRISGSAGMRKQQELIKKHFEELGAKVQFQTFKAKQKSIRGEVDMTNIIVSFHPDKKRRVILCSHYDTRPIADQEPDERKWRDPFVSANDGGSGVALLMELAHHMKDLKTNVGVDFVIFDGEEYIFEGNRDEYFIGSRYFAESWVKSKNGITYSGAILLDMIAGKNLRIPYERHSYNRFPKLCHEVWSIARELDAKAFLPFPGYEVRDDHIMLQHVGIPAIDLIDFDYPHWHRLSDTPENCSGESMAQVAKVLSVWLQRTK